jgi:hypothetical protein
VAVRQPAEDRHAGGNGWLGHGLADMPFDLLPEACRAAFVKQRQHWKVPPCPGDLIEAVAEEIAKRKRSREGVKTLMLKIRTALGIRLMPQDGEFLGPPDKLKRLT